MFESFNELLNNSRSLLVQNEDINDKIKGINERLESIEAMLASLKTKAPQQEDLFSQSEETETHKTRPRIKGIIRLSRISKILGINGMVVDKIIKILGIESFKPESYSGPNLYITLPEFEQIRQFISSINNNK